MINTLTIIDESIFAELREEMFLRQTTELFVLYGLGSQYDHLIKLRLAALGVFVVSADPSQFDVNCVAALHAEPNITLRGIILSGGPASVHTQDETVIFDTDIFNCGVPVLGICLGFQLWAQAKGFQVVRAKSAEFGEHSLAIHEDKIAHDHLFHGVPNHSSVVQSHHDRVEADSGLIILASTASSPVAAAQYGHLWGVQFHPEVSHTQYGSLIMENFCFRICGAKDRFAALQVAERKIYELRLAIGSERVIIAFSGGTDSTTATELVGKALEYEPDRVFGIYIKGVDRADDAARALQFAASRHWFNLVVIEARDDFLRVLANIHTMSEKRTAMRPVYKRILVEAASRIGAKFIVQGTLYTDITESGGGIQGGARKAKIKQHHNVNLDFGSAGLTELTPLDDQVKDTGRAIGAVIGVPAEILASQPFPGSGLIVRIIGPITQETLEIAHQTDQIFIRMLREWGLYEEVWQAGTIVTDVQTTVTKGDEAGSELVIALRAVTSLDGFTADFARLPWEFIKAVSICMTNEVQHVGRVVYDVTGKPPGTIEWG